MEEKGEKDGGKKGPDRGSLSNRRTDRQIERLHQTEGETEEGR